MNESRTEPIVFVAAHKPYRGPAAGYLKTIQTGPIGTPYIPESVSHETGDSIAYKSEYLCELTALYWIWRNTDHEVFGLCHYRRYFGEYATTSGAVTRIQPLSQARLSQMLRDPHAVVVPKVQSYWPFTVRQHYAFSHDVADLDVLKGILGEKCPEYLPHFDTVLSQRSLHLYNMIIARRVIVDEYCRWIFLVLAEAEARGLHLNKVGRQRRVYGFLAERLLNVWLDRHRVRLQISECPILETEPRPSLVRAADLVRRVVIHYGSGFTEGIRKGSRLSRTHSCIPLK